MLYNPPTGGAANDPYVGKNVAAGQQGSKVPPGAVEYPQREIMAVINDAIAEGLAIAASNGDLTQLLQAIKFLIPKYTPAGAGVIGAGGLRKDGSNNFGLDLANLNGGVGFTAPDIFAFRRASDGALLAGTLAQVAALTKQTLQIPAPGTGFSISKKVGTYQPSSPSSQSISQEFVAPCTGTVLAFSTASSTAQPGLANSISITVNGGGGAATADSVGGSINDVASCQVKAGDDVVVTSTISNSQALQYNVSQQLNFIFFPS